MRTKEEINTEYAAVCTQLGDLIVKHQLVQDQLMAKVAALNEEMQATEKEEEPCV